MSGSHPNKDMIALGVRQPWAELILRGVKTVEVRSQPTNVRGPVYVYSSKKLSEIDPAEQAVRNHGIAVELLPFGVIVGTVDIVDSRTCRSRDAAAACVPKSYLKGQFAWRLENPTRFDEPLTVRFLPYGVWFYPFRRRHRR